MKRVVLLLLCGVALGACHSPRGRSCLGFFEKCGEQHRCVHYYERTGLEGTCEVPCQSDADCAQHERCLLPGEEEYGPVNVCITKTYK